MPRDTATRRFQLTFNNPKEHDYLFSMTINGCSAAKSTSAETSIFRVFGESKHYTRTPDTMAIICLRVWVVHTPRGTSAKTGNMLLACIMLL